MAVAQRMTVTEYLARDYPQPRWTSLIEGDVVVNSPLPVHQRAFCDLHFAVTAWCRAEAGRGEATAPLDVQLGDHSYFAPDLLWYRSGREPGRSLVAPQPLPDIAVEIRSPSTWHYDIGVKKRRYEQHGLPELWLVDTAADVILVFRRSSPTAPEFDVEFELARGELLTSPQLPGFTLVLDELFGEPTATS